MDGPAAAARDAVLAAAVEDLRGLALFGGHRLDDRFGVLELVFVDVARHLAELAGEHFHQ